VKENYHIIILVAACFLMTACSNTRHLPAGEKLYTGARTTVNGTSTVREKKVLKEDLEGLTRPKPNSKFLGIPIKLSIYNLFRNKKENSFFGKIRDKNGEPPVLLSQVDLQQNIKVLQSHMENKGYFHAKVSGDTIVGRRRAHARYDIVAGDQYKIAAVSFPPDSSVLALTINESSNKTLLKTGKPFDLDVIKAERIRIDAYLKENGFYYFTPEFLLIKTDTTIGNHLVNMYVTVKKDIPFESREPYKIKNVQIYTGYSLNMERIDSSKAQAQYYKGYYIIDRRKRFKPYMFAEAMNFEPGDVYNRTDHNLTLSRLVNLDLFKFVKNRFEINKQTDSAYLDVFYYLTPLPRKSLKAEFTTITRSNNLNGSLISVGWKDRNLFKGGEHLSLSAYTGSDVQFGGTLQGNAIRFGGEINFGIPRVLVPFGDFGIKGGYMPRTNIQLGYDMLDRVKYYSLNSFRTAFGYLWKESLQKQHELYPISVTFVEPGKVTEEYKTLIHQDTLLARAVQKQFILGSTYQFNYNQLANGLQTNNAYYFNGFIGLSGNLAGLFSGANVKAGKEVLIRDVPFSQYIKFELDGRYYRKLGLYSTWANRAIIGVGIPYGNSVQLPFIKQFFIGGNNSLRGFRSHSVGPGTYKYVDTTNTFFPDETGDLKLELNSEFRFRLTGPLYGALFVDAGNIWLWNDSTYTHKPGSEFTSKFLSQLAVDAGFGFRFDITLFVIRLDIAFPLREPWRQNPWVIDQIKFFNKPWRRENIIYNLGIGYPF
jgi:outer membrane protein insertion porin family